MKTARHLLLTAGLLYFSVLQAQPQDWKTSVLEFQAGLNRQFADPEKSPLDKTDQPNFKCLEFFPVSKSYCVKARFLRTEGEAPFEMPTVSGKTKTFVKYGELRFRLKGRSDTLFVYQNLKNLESEENKDLLFIPFKDMASGEEAYGGGRYIDWKIPTKKRVMLDFNKCYNPYCAYSGGWNCPIPPPENFVDNKVLAGVKAWKPHH